MEEEHKTDWGNIILKSVIALLFFIGAALFCYPFVSDAINNYYDQYMISQYHEVLKVEIKQEKEKLENKNTALFAERKTENIPGRGADGDPFAATFKEAKKTGGADYEMHMIGALFIPAIQVSIPLFDETTPSLLDKGATVLQGTSYPIGGRNTHAVISAHSGLPDRTFFTNLDKLIIGDQFYLEVLGEKLAYQVQQIQTILPTEGEALAIQTQEDLVTLLTCTPYGVNTHRLLVTGRRIPYKKEQMDQSIKQIHQQITQTFWWISACLALILLGLFYWLRRAIIFYQSSNYLYSLSFYLFSMDEPVKGEKFILYSKSAPEEENPLYAVSDENGFVCFNSLRGGCYWVKSSNPAAKIKFKGRIRSLRDQTFHLSGNSSFFSIRKNFSKQCDIIDWRNKNE